MNCQIAKGFHLALVAYITATLILPAQVLAQVYSPNGTALTAKQISAGALPTGGKAIFGLTDSDIYSNNRNMTVTQREKRAAIDWDSFDIGTEATVQFIQPDAKSTIINRVMGEQSQINGQLLANGKVYLLNQNGILFGKNSRVNTQAFLASSFDITKVTLVDPQIVDFVARTDAEEVRTLTQLAALYENRNNSDDALAEYQEAFRKNWVLHLSNSSTVRPGEVTNRGIILSKEGGSVVLIAPTVKNEGYISAPSGNAQLVGATTYVDPKTGIPEAAIVYDDQTTYSDPSKPDDTERIVFARQKKSFNMEFSEGPRRNENGDYVDVDGNLIDDEDISKNYVQDAYLAGDSYATNTVTGQVHADQGVVGMYGNWVRQQGLLSSVTAVTQGGKIELRAANRVTLDAASRTITPISDSEDSFALSLNKNVGVIDIRGDDRVVINGEVTAPSGEVYVKAGQRVLVGSTGSINVGGLTVNSTAAVTMTAQLNSAELSSEPAQQDGIFSGQTVTTIGSQGTNIGNVADKVGQSRIDAAAPGEGYNKYASATAQERASQGGEITIQGLYDDLGNNTDILDEVILLQGGLIDFSGGGLYLAPSLANTTKVYSGGKLYDIYSAPDTLKYDGVLNDLSVEFERYGIKKTFKGTYAGGANPILSLLPTVFEGADAGMLTIQARNVQLLGTVLGHATSGIMQTEVSQVDGLIGVTLPTGGQIIIGEAPHYLPLSVFEDQLAEEMETFRDLITGGIEVASSSQPLAADFNADTPLPAELSSTSYIADSTLSGGLSSITLYSNKDITIPAGAEVSLSPLGKFTTISRSASILGSILAPSGTIDIQTLDTFGSLNTDDAENEAFQGYFPGIFVAAGATLSVAGQKVDYRQSGQTQENLPSEYLNGGSITLKDLTYFTEFQANETDSPRTDGTPRQGVVLQTGSLVDVSGGYIVSQDGSITGGDAGALTVAGPSLVLDGTLSGYSIIGQDGGTITLHAENVDVVTEANALAQLPSTFNTDSTLPDLNDEGTALPDAERYRNRLVLSDERLTGTGFTSINLKSDFDLNVTSGVSLQPSYLKLSPTAGVSLVNGQAPTGESLIIADARTIGSGTQISLSAGNKLFSSDEGALVSFGRAAYGTFLHTYSVNVEAGSTITTAPQGKIEISGHSLFIGGTLTALSGAIKLSANAGDLTLLPTARLHAQGFNQPRQTAAAPGIIPGYEPLPGGSIALAASGLDNLTDGIVRIEAGAQLNVSGSDAVQNTVSSSDSQGLGSVIEASAPGSIEIAFSNNYVIEDDASLLANAALPTLPGGIFSLEKTATGIPFELYPETIARFQRLGFYDLTFASNGALRFRSLTDTFSTSVAEKLTLDAHSFVGDGVDVSLFAPWIVLRASKHSSTQAITTAAENTFSATAGNFLDLEGDVSISLFDTVSLSASDAIRTSMKWYSEQNPSGSPFGYIGALHVPVDLNITTPVLYPLTISNSGRYDGSNNPDVNVFTPSTFKLSAPNGTITTSAPTGSSAPELIPSAGCTLIVNAQSFVHGTTFAAPMGTILIGENGETEDEEFEVDSVILKSGGVLTTRGTGTLPLGYLFTKGQDWRVTSSLSRSTFNSYAGASAGGVSFNAASVETAEGSLIDTSGGGEVFAYKFNPAKLGDISPLKQSGGFVVVPGLSIPGKTVYLEASAGLPAGYYSVLPEEYAFMPGAFYVVDLGVLEAEAGLTGLKSQEGYQVSSGYWTDTAHRTSTPRSYGFVVRTAESVLAQGEFLVQSATAVDGSDISFYTQANILNGSFRANALSGGIGGGLLLGGSSIEIVNQILSNALSQASSVASADSLTQAGFSNITFGQTSLDGEGQDVTETITVADNVILDGANLLFNAYGKIVIGDGAQINATDDTGKLTLRTPQLFIGEGASLEGGDEVHIDMVSSTVTGHERDIHLDLAGSIGARNSSLRLSANDIYFKGDDFSAENGSNALYLTETQVQNLAFDDITFEARGDAGTPAELTQGSISFLGDVSLTIQGELTLLANAFRAGDSSSAATLEATRISLISTKEADHDDLSELTVASGGSTLTLNATAQTPGSTPEVVIGPGEVLLEGFSAVNLNSQATVAFAGKTLLASSGALTINAESGTVARPYEDSSGGYDSADVIVRAGESENALLNITFAASGAGTPDISAGGRMRFFGNNINVEGLIAQTTGELELHAEQDLTVAQGGRIINTGTPTATTSDTVLGGGNIRLTSNTGSITLEPGSLLDVSGGNYGDSGAIVLKATDDDGSVTFGGVGSLLGVSNVGNGGSFGLDTNDVDLDALSQLLAGGQFVSGEAIAVRDRKGSLNLNAENALSAHNVALTSDKGSITIAGKVSANGSAGGLISLSAQDGVSLLSGSVLQAKAEEANGDGGEVFVNVAKTSTDTGWTAINFADGATIDVSGNARKGTVHFRAHRNASMTLQGDVSGQKWAVAEGYEIYKADKYSNNTVLDDAIAYADANSGNVPSQWTLLAGVELQSDGNDTSFGDTWNLPSWDLTSWRTEATTSDGTTLSLPIALTIRTAGDLVVQGDIFDAPATTADWETIEAYTYNFTASAITPTDDLNSAFITLVAGADFSSADILATLDAGTLTFEDSVVYSETANIRLAAGEDIKMSLSEDSTPRGYMFAGISAESSSNAFDYVPSYNVGTFNGSIRINTGGTLDLTENGAIQSAVGNIYITAKDVDLTAEDGQTGGAIRTTGYYPYAIVLPVWTPLPPFLGGSRYIDKTIGGLLSHSWDYIDGGDINLNVQDSITGSMSPSAWADWNRDSITRSYQTPEWTISEHEFQWTANYGVVSPGFGGSADTISNDAFAGIGTLAGGNLNVTAGGSVAAQIGTFGRNNEGDLTVFAGQNLNGRFLTANGNMLLTTTGSLGLGIPEDADFADLTIEALDANVTLTAMGQARLGGIANPTLSPKEINGSVLSPRELSYTQNTSFSVRSIANSIIMSFQSNFYDDITTLPGTFELYAQEDILLLNDGDLILAPSPTGSLVLEAGNDIVGQADSSVTQFIMSDALPNQVYKTYTNSSASLDLTGNSFIHADSAEDTPSIITAGGSIRNIRFNIAESAAVTAGQDLDGFAWRGLHSVPGQVTLIRAGGDILLDTIDLRNTILTSDSNARTGIRQNLYGDLIVSAGGSIELGSSLGIQSASSAGAPEQTSSNILVIAGYSLPLLSGNNETDSLSIIRNAFFDDGDLDDVDSLMDFGLAVAGAQTAEDEEAEASFKAEAREFIANFLGEPTGAGNITLLESEITTNRGGSIDIIAAGTLDMGRSFVETNSDGTIKSPKTGITTKFGGNINIFAEEDINVFESRLVTFYGGDILLFSSTGDINAGRGSSTAVTPPEIDSDGNITPPGVGSGVRTLTFDLPGQEDPEQGDAAIFALDGVIDAGEAGISAKNVTLAAEQVLNAQNVTVAGTSVGVPAATTAVAGLGALTGNSGLNETSELAQQASVDAAKEQRDAAARAQAMARDLAPWQMDVRIIRFLP